MATSLQRVLVISITIKMVFVIAMLVGTGSAYNGELVFSTLDTQSNEAQETAIETYPDSTLDDDSNIIDRVFGDIKVLQEDVFNLFRIGWGHLGKSDVDTSDPIANSLRYGVNSVFNIVNILLVLEILFIFWSKKSS